MMLYVVLKTEIYLKVLIFNKVEDNQDAWITVNVWYLSTFLLIKLECHPESNLLLLQIYKP